MSCEPMAIVANSAESTTHNYFLKTEENIRKRRSLTRSVLGRLVDFCSVFVWFLPMDVRSSTIHIHSSRLPHLFRFCNNFANRLFSAHSTCTIVSHPCSSGRISMFDARRCQSILELNFRRIGSAVFSISSSVINAKLMMANMQIRCAQFSLLYETSLRVDVRQSAPGTIQTADQHSPKCNISTGNRERAGEQRIKKPN